MSAESLLQMLCLSLSLNISKHNHFVRFFPCYFKENALCEVFYVSYLYTMDLPKPQKSVFSNMKYLQDITMYDNILGLKVVTLARRS